MTRFGKLALGAVLMAGTAIGATAAVTTPADARVVVGVGIGVPGYYPGYSPYYGYYGYPAYYGYPGYYGGPYVGVGWGGYGWRGGCCWGGRGYGWRGGWGGWHGGWGGRGGFHRGFAGHPTTHSGGRR